MALQNLDFQNSQKAQNSNTKTMIANASGVECVRSVMDTVVSHKKETRVQLAVCCLVSCANES